MTNNIMFPLQLRSDLKEEGAQAQLSMNSQENERNVAVVTQVNFQAEVLCMWFKDLSHFFKLASKALPRTT